MNEKLTTTDHLDLALYNWETKDAQCDLLFIHGFFEHAGRYTSEAQYFNEAKINVFSYDQRTHGLSNGRPRSFIKNFDDYLNDLRAYLNQSELGKHRPFFILAHSMGGLLLVSYLIDNLDFQQKLTGVILSAPFLETDENTAPLLQKLAGIVGTLLPRLKVLSLEPNDISNDPQEVEKYLNDPLIYTDKMYAGSAWQMIRQIKKIKPHFSKITVPLFILHGSKDAIANPKGSHLLFERAKSSDKSIEILEGQKHEILKDTAKKGTLELIKNFIVERI